MAPIMSIGIQDWGVWVPYYRLTSDLVRGAFGTGGNASRALASFDEDAVTMAVEAVRRLATPAELLYFASVSAPYAEKQHAAIIAGAADWLRHTATADWSAGLRAGTSALQGALDAVAAGRVKRAAVVASDRRPVGAGTPSELAFGDAAVSFSIGDDPVFEFQAQATVAAEIVDSWRMDGGAAVLETDAKFAEQQSYTVFQGEALAAALEKAGWRIADLTRVYFWGPDSRIWTGIGKSAGLTGAQLPAESLFSSVGSLGVAHPFALLCADAHTLKPGDKIAVCGHGAGADALLFTVTEKIRSAPLQAWREATRWSAPWPNYGAHLRARGLIAGEKLDPFTAPPILLREEAALLRRRASVCDVCGTLHYPPQPLCRNCHGKSFTSRPLGNEGTIFVMTADHLYPSALQPTVMVSADIDGGGRFYGQITDARADESVIGGRVQFTYRRIHEGGGFINYFWKLRPVRATT
jgi:3-hydroxy-3-methylglutaryl CoA synthase/uncharacterized OB-fold protein